jgi:transcriptional regulator with XRE-family HTH domain
LACVTTQALEYRLNFAKFELLTKARGWTNDLQRARGIGVSHSTIGRLRRGDMKPGLYFIGRATAALGVDIEDLFDRVGPAEAA